MAPEQVLNRRLTGAARRVRLVLAWRWGLRAVIAALCVCVTWVLASRVSLVDAPEPEWVLGFVAGSVLVAAVVVLLLRLPRLEVARLLDRRAGTRERLASAVEFGGQAEANPLVGRLVADAADHAANVDLRRTMPLRGGAELASVVVLGGALFALYFAPRMPLFWSQEKKADAARVRTQGDQVERLAREAEKVAAAQKLPATAAAARQARALAAKMKRGALDRKAALVQMHKLTARMEREQRRLAMAEGGLKSMEQAGREAQQALQRKSDAVARANAQRKAGAMHRPDAKPEPKRGQTEAGKRAQEALKRFTEAVGSQDGAAQEKALQDLAEQMQKGGLSSAEMDDLRGKMQDLAKALKGSRLDSVSAGMAKLAQAMKSSGLKFDPNQLKACSSAMKKLAGMCGSCCKGNMDAKMLAALIEAMKRGDRKFMCSGGGKGGKGAGLAYVANRDEGKRVKLAAAAPNARVNGKHGAGKESAPTMTYVGAPDRNVSAGSPYFQVLAQQRKVAEGAVGRENVPAPYRKQVRDYFDTIRP